MSNFQDAISAEALKALHSKATERTMKENAPWKGTEESVGDPDLGIIQQAIDAVDDNCEFPILEFLKGSHYALYLYIRNLEQQMMLAAKKEDHEALIFFSGRLGEIRVIYNALADALGANDDDDDEEDDTEA